jgi:hypothetical protein
MCAGIAIFTHGDYFSVTYDIFTSPMNCDICDFFNVLYYGLKTLIGKDPDVFIFVEYTTSLLQ